MSKELISNAKYLKENPKATIIPFPEETTVSRIYREGVYAVEDRLRKVGEKGVKGPGEILHTNDFPLKHSFTEGVYMRELTIPKSTFLVSFLHRESYFSYLMEGDLTMLTEDGGQRLKAPMVLTSPRGTKRILYAHETSIWCTSHPNPTNTTDIEELEARIHVTDAEGRYEVLDNIIDVNEDIEAKPEVNVYRFFSKFIGHCLEVDKEIEAVKEGGMLCQV